MSSDDLQVRLVAAVIEELRDDDVMLVIGVGTNEIRIGWEPQ